MASAFVSPSTTRLPLPDLGPDAWVEAKGELGYAEQTELADASLKPDGTLNYPRYLMERMVAFVVDWSFRDADDKPVPVSRSAIENLSGAAAKAVNEALNAHVAAAEEKKAAPNTRSAKTPRSS